MKSAFVLVALASVALLVRGFFVASPGAGLPGKTNSEVGQVSTEQLVPGTHVKPTLESPIAAGERVSAAAPKLVEVEAESPAPIQKGVTIQVVDEGGQPLGGVRVCVLSTDASYQLWAGLTEDGTGTIDTGIEWLSRRAKGSYRGTLYACLDGPFPNRDAVMINPSSLPEKPIVLTLPIARGSLEVHCVDSEGSPISARSVSVEISRTTLGPTAFAGSCEEKGSGIFVVDALSIGQTLQIQGDAIPPWASLEESFAGPTLAGERRVVELEFTSSIPTIKGQLTGKDGASLGPTSLVLGSVSTVSPSRSRGNLLFKPDADGRFLTPMSGRIEPGELCEFTFRSHLMENPSVELIARAVHAAPGPGEVVDLGQIDTEEVQASITGFVLDDRGHPIPGANIWIKRTSKHTRTSLLAGHILPRSVSLDDGSFSISALPAEGEFALEARKAGFVTAKPVPVVSEANGIVLTMEPGRIISGVALLPEGVSSKRITLDVQTTDEKKNQSIKRISLRDDGTFDGSDLPAGPLRLAVLDSASSQVLFHIPEFFPWTAGSLADPGLNPLDLRDKIAAFIFRAETPDGEPVKVGFASKGETSYLIDDGFCEGLTASGFEKLRVGGRGLRTREFDIYEVPGHVILQPGIPVRLLAPSPWPSTIPREGAVAYLLPMARELKLSSLRGRDSKGGYVRFFHSLPVSFADANQVEITVSKVGKYQVMWHEPARFPGGFELLIAAAPRQVVEVTGVGSIQVIQLSAE